MTFLEKNVINAAGIAIRAADSGRVLLQQRGYDPLDPASGKFEFPGGHIEGDESPAEAAVREWREETGVELPDGEMIANWICPIGTYQTFLWEIPSESNLPINVEDSSRIATNPDDPDNDLVETLAWFDVATLPGNPILRDEMQQAQWQTLSPINTITMVPPAVKSRKQQRSVAIISPGNQLVLPGPLKHGDKIVVQHNDDTQDTYDVENYDNLGKAQAPRRAGHRRTIALSESLHDRVTEYYAPRIAKAMKRVTGIQEAIAQAKQVWPATAKALGDDENPIPDATPITTEGFSESGTPSSIEQEIAKSAVRGNVGFNIPGIKNIITDLYADGSMVGMNMGARLSDLPSPPKSYWDAWKPGDPNPANLVANGGLRRLLDELDITIAGLTDSAMDRMGNVLAEGLRQGLPPKQIAADMSDIIADKQRALTIARTESARAQSMASLNQMNAAGTAAWIWHANAGACPLCLGYEADSLAEPFPIGGGPAFPGHPNCRCTPMPFVDYEH